MKLTVTADPVFKAFLRRLETAPKWYPQIIHRRMRELGRPLVQLMREQVAEHNYTGKLSRSIKSEYDASAMELAIFPSAQRGNYDAGLLLELGARPHRAPFAPIKRWAAARGVPAGPVWYAISQRGVKAHPFVAETGARAQSDIAKTGDNIQSDAAKYLTGG